MSHRKTLFIIGAGASKEVGLPIGSDLKQAIATKVNLYIDNYGRGQNKGDHYIIEALRQHVKLENGNINLFTHAGRRIHDGITHADSIDYFLSRHAEDKEMQLCGKLGIVRSIIEAERNSKLWADGRVVADPRPDLSQIQKTWYPKCFNKIFAGLSKDKLGEKLENIAFIIFNYDRCIEHYLIHAIRSSYSIDESEAAHFVKYLKIIHPYGVIGDLPWQNSNDNVAYGDDSVYGEKLIRVANKIKTFIEQVNENEIISKSKNMVSEADTIIFLGFEFHPQNMDFINPGTASRANNIFATAYEESQEHCELLKKQLSSMIYKSKLEERTEIIKNISCLQLFEQYHRAMNL